MSWREALTPRTSCGVGSGIEKDTVMLGKAAECRRLRQRLRSLHDTRTDADYTTVAVATTVQEAPAIAREILAIVRRYEQQ